MKCKTFYEYYLDTFKNFEDFEKATKGVLYVEQPDGQIELCFINKDDYLDLYHDYYVVGTWKVNIAVLHIILKKDI